MNRPPVVKGDVLQASASSIVTIFVLVAIYLLLLFTGCPTQNYRECNHIVTVVAALSYVALLYHAFRLTRSISLYFLLLLVTYPFYFGKQLLVALDIEPARIYISTAPLTVSSTWESSFFILLSLSILQLGYCLFAKRRNPGLREKASIARNTKSFFALRKASLFMVVFLVMPTLIYLIQNIQLTNLVGYGTRISEYGRSGIANILGILAVIMPYALLAAFMTRKKGEKWQIIGTCVYSVLYMMQGSRTDVFVLALAFAYIWYLCYSKKSAATSLLQMVIALVLLAALFSFGSFARAGFSDTGTISDVDESNMIIEALGEAASTYTVTAKTIEMVPVQIPTAGGETYVAGLLYILPNGLTDNAYAQSKSVDEVLSPYLTSYGGVGSSFIAEAYFNFGKYSLIVFFLYGVFIAFLQNFAEKSYERGAYGSMFACCASFMLISFYIRSDVRTFPRYFIWNALPVLIIQQIILPRVHTGADEGGLRAESTTGKSIGIGGRQ